MQMDELLKISWQRCWSGLHANGDGLALMQQLVGAYEDPQRKYHTVQHLCECLALHEQHLDLAVDAAEVGMALWFHDAIYNVKASDNEAKSAQWAATELTAAGVAPEKIARIEQHILATRHAVLPEGGDQQLLVDIDLAILGAPRSRFEEYEQQVRAEYGWVPEFLFRRTRRGILQEFLARDPIYNTQQFREMRESQARANLNWSLAQLGS